MLRGWLFDRALKKLRRSKEPVIADYAHSVWPDPDTPAGQASYCALDFELDGLREDADILQVGWLPFEGQTIRLDSARSLDIRSMSRLDDDAVAIHGIGEQRAEAGVPLKAAFRELLPDLGGRIIIAHGASIERRALSRMAKSVFGTGLPIRAICTLALERRIHPNLVGTDPYRLGASRARYRLPASPLHDALEDAIATAELFQAQLLHLPRDTVLKGLETV
jgi:DNA polymerase-3 subunit epsilon